MVPGEGEREVPGREGEREGQVEDRLDQPDEEPVEQVAERDPDQPADGGEGEPGTGDGDPAREMPVCSVCQAWIAISVRIARNPGP